MTARAKTRHGLTRTIKRETGGKQGGVIMATLFSKMMDVLAEENELDDHIGVSFEDLNIGTLLWVDDVVTLAEGEMQQTLTLKKIE